MAGYLQAAGGNEPHIESEPNLMGDNSGAGAGLIATYLKHKFAVSLTVGYIVPFKFQQVDSNIVIKYSNAVNYSLSFGYLLLPRTYRDYKQVNLNIYLEFMGESYGAAFITKNNKPVFSGGIPSLAKGNYLEVRPGAQLIFASNTSTFVSFSSRFSFRLLIVRMQKPIRFIMCICNMIFHFEVDSNFQISKLYY